MNGNPTATIHVAVTGKPVSADDLAKAINRLLPQIEGMIEIELDTRREGGRTVLASVRVER